MSYEQREKANRRRCFRYSIFSLLLTFVLIFCTGCAALLTGDNKKAYDLLVKASDDFYFPSSVQIVSGEMLGKGMYCVIRAKNRYGTFVENTYYITSSGSPLQDYDRSCYSKKLNYDLINNALAAHYGINSFSLFNIFNDLSGGYTMSTAIIIITIIVVLILNGYLASNASDMANDKGYDKRKWFHMCFWLGPISYIIIAAMPDRIMRSNQDKTNELLNKMIESYNKTTAKIIQNQKEEENKKDDISTYLPDL